MSNGLLRCYFNWIIFCFSKRTINLIRLHGSSSYLGRKCCMTLNYRIGTCFFIEKLTNVKWVSFKQSVPVRIYQRKHFIAYKFSNKNRPLVSVLLTLRVPVSFFLSIQLCYCYCSIILSKYHFFIVYIERQCIKY